MIRFTMICLLSLWVAYWVAYGVLLTLEAAAPLFGRKPRRKFNLPRHR